MKHYAGVFPLLLIASFCSLYSEHQSRDEYLKAYEQRARYETILYDTMQNPGIYGATVRYAENRDLAVADSLLLNCSQIKHPQGDMFWMYPVIGTYLHGKGKMSAAAAAAVRNAWKTYAPYRGDTENHWAMYYASLYLAAEQWRNLPGSEWFNGKSSEENLNDAKEYLIHWIHITTTIGQGEFDSPDYLPEYMNAMTLLAEFAKDPAMKQRGKMMLDYLLADFAVDELGGEYIGGFSRIYQPAVYKPWLSGASAFAYLYFGTGGPVQSGWTLLSALSDYRLPQIIYDIATDRSHPFVNKERKRIRNILRYRKEMNPPVYKYSYITKDYGIGSLQGGILQPIQQHTWGVRYLYGKPTSTIFGLHPYWSGYELAMFFPEERKTMIADVVSSKGTYNKDDKWTSSSPYERTFQHKNTVIVLYDISPGTTSEHIDGFFPKNLQRRIVDPSGWIMCKAGDTYIGWYPLQEYRWMQLKDDEDNFRLRSYKLQNGYVVEVRSKDEVGSFEKFGMMLRKHLPTAVLKPGAVSVKYTTLRGDRMFFAFPRTRMLNGKEVNLGSYKLFDSPFAHADVGSEKLTLTYKNRKMVLDFKKLSITK
ncbi:MAG: hypothetical protein KGJ59_00885 [Bacteroidota bacterium]|nr:hypothetical protein [Bacteroidota bacterium]